MKKTITFIFAFIVSASFLISCSTETEEETIGLEEKITDQSLERRGTTTGHVNFCYAETVPVSPSAMTLCSDVYSLNDITVNVPYNAETNDIVDELKGVFYCNEEFSTCMGAPQPLEVCSVTFSIEESPNLFGTYDFLSDDISPAISNQIKQHFACVAKDYGDSTYSEYQIAHVTFYQDQLLCDNCTRYLVAQVSYYVY
ncbi:hypothetical protein [Dokdonia sp.]|uniref:hypothetical protein n=1 Tax=Dokdonia sp. TaxID=2024995 RepID=UPI0032676861